MSKRLLADLDPGGDGGPAIKRTTLLISIFNCNLGVNGWAVGKAALSLGFVGVAALAEQKSELQRSQGK